MTTLFSMSSKTKSILSVNLTQWQMSALLTTLLLMSSKTKSIPSVNLAQWQMSSSLTTLLSMSSIFKSISSVNLHDHSIINELKTKSISSVNLTQWHNQQNWLSGRWVLHDLSIINKISNQVNIICKPGSLANECLNDHSIINEF